MPHKKIHTNQNDVDIFSKLPNEIYYKILANIKATDLFAITLASKRIYQILKDDDYVWHLMCQSQYPKKRILEVKENIISDVATKKELKDIERKRNAKRNSTTTNVRKRNETNEEFEEDSSNEYSEEYGEEYNGGYGEECGEGEESDESEEKEYCEEKKKEEVENEQNEMDSQKNIITWKDLYKYLSNPIIYMAREREICWLDCSEVPFNRHHWSTVIYPESEYGKVVCLNYVWLFKVIAKLKCVQPGNYDIIWKFRVNKNSYAGLSKLNFETRLLHYNYQDQEVEGKEELVLVKTELSCPNLFKEISFKNDWVEHCLYHQIVVPERRNNDIINNGENFWYNVECKISNYDRYQKRGLWIDYVKLRHHKK
ncbi:hypothetical protein Glove_482g73 [Diversispora epigaea]|uniref:F-box domain-containing protein n=1 Tax=Diversispora epigaea TaxID=1348612 RepID=A0A397GNR9_9GLOM|nr:hypothetical protein Glove_482g73 [Diversispora epigaea]